MPDTSENSDKVFDLNFEPTWVSQPVNPYIDDDKAYRDKARSRSEKPRKGRNRDDSKGRHPRGGKPPRRDQRPFDGRKRDHRPPPPPEPAFTADVVFIPERRGLHTLVKKITQAEKAFSLYDIAGLVLSRPEFHAVKITVADSSQDHQLYQCGGCSMVFMDESECMDHLFGCCMQEHFNLEETEGEPPKGQFSAVVQCPRTREVLGPPNYHGFNDRLRELHRSRFSHMSLDDYRSSLKTLHDEEALEKWKEEARRKVVYQLKDSETTFSRRQEAVEHFRKHFQAQSFKKSGRFIMAGPVSLKISDGALRRHVRSAWGRENRHPFKLSMALRAAFRHHKLHVFKSANGHHYVSAIAASAIDPSTAVPEIRALLEHIESHPGCSRKELFESLSPETPQEELNKHLTWLRHRGHVIEFANGSLAVPSKKRPANSRKKNGHSGTDKSAD